MSYQRHSTGADSTENMPPVNIEVSGSGIVLKETKKGALLDFSDPAPAAAAGPAAATAAAGAADLQAAFRDFQLKRRAEHKRTAELARLKRAEQKSSEAKAILRAKFLAAVREYLGVPYAVRFHSKPGEGPCECEGCTEAGEQLAERPLFLDCCALVRRAVSDLQEDFGFRLGPGNQAYQFDTLPVRVGTVEELEPGDLVFYEGVFFIEGKKAQPHDMLHVEVFVGGESGEAVIGSRERHKWVKEYDSYKFQSKSWTLKKHYFCKIDTWLEGTLKSFCPEHAWPVRASKPMGRGSVFHADAEGGGEGGEGGEGEGGEEGDKADDSDGEA